jgi:hypothetical protein
MAIEITWYTDNLRSQVIDLFVQEYGVNKKEFNTLFERFYFHPFQKNKCLLIVALDGGTVAGFQSFFFWPYMFEGKTFNSFQSGNSLVNPAYRGQGLFNKMLAFINQENETKEVDFLMGFPVEASLRNFIKDKWSNILDLRWYIKFGNPFGFSGRLNGKNISNGLKYFPDQTSFAKNITLNSNTEFTSWRENYLKRELYYSFHYKDGNDEIIFHLKKNKRKKILNELVIGNIIYNSPSAVSKTSGALQRLNSFVRNSFSFHFISCAFNERCSLNISSEFLKAGFKPTEKKIHFIVKPYKNNTFVESPEKWLLFRSDIDTW